MPRSVNRAPDSTSEEIKQALAETAYRLFREKSFDQVGVRDIAAALGMTTGAVYYYFKNKSEILEYRASRKSDWLAEQVPALLEGLPPEAKILRLLSGYLCDIFEEEGYALCEDRMFIKHYSRRESPQLLELLNRLTEECVRSGALPAAVPVPEVVDHLLIACRGVEYDWCLHQGACNLRARMRQQISMVLRYFKTQNF